MFTYIELKNFISFKETVFDFRDNNYKAKDFISIYGENGSGKSNFIDSIALLKMSINSLNIIDTDKLSKTMSRDNIISFLKDINLLSYVTDCRMIECEEETSVTYGFEYNSNKGYYVLSFKDKFVYEKLCCYINGKDEELFEIKNKDGKINISFSDKLFFDKELENEIKDKINKLWGNHTLLSILNKECSNFIYNSYSKYVFNLLNMIRKIYIHCRKSLEFEQDINTYKQHSTLSNLSYGKIDIKAEDMLNSAERILKEFFTQAYSDIKDVFYKKDIDNDKLTYKLFVRKMIAGKIRLIDFSKESAGTQQVLEVITIFLNAFDDNIVVYDEVDNGIHEILLNKILTSMFDYCKGQIIITTHNTHILDTASAKSVYVINTDYLENKCVNCLSDYKRGLGKNNFRSMYLKGLFGGIPLIETLDYDIALEELVK